MYTKEMLEKKICEISDAKPLFMGAFVDYLLSFFTENETLLCYENLAKLDDEQGCLVITNQNIYFITTGLIRKRKEFSFKKINSVEKTVGVVFGDIKLSGSGFSVNFKNIVKTNLDKIEKTINDNIKEDSANVIEIREDVIEKIKKLAELKNEGILTEEEFNTKKQELLDKI